MGVGWILRGLIKMSVVFFFNDTTTTEIYTLSPTRRSTDLASCYQIGTFMGRVAKLRRDHKLSPPAGTIGHDCPEDLARAIRAQHNRIEFFPLFLASKWITAMFYCPYAASAMGSLYMYGSQRYVNG